MFTNIILTAVRQYDEIVHGKQQFPSHNNDDSNVSFDRVRSGSRRTVFGAPREIGEFVMYKIFIFIFFFPRSVEVVARSVCATWSLWSPKRFGTTTTTTVYNTIRSATTSVGR